MFFSLVFSSPMKKFNLTIVALTVAFGLGLIGPISAHAAGPATVDLLTAGNFTVLAKTGISALGPVIITGDIAVSPAVDTSITGFTLNLPAGSAFSTSPLVTGKVYAPNYANPTPANTTAAISDMQTAYSDAAGRKHPTATQLGAGNIGGLTIAPGLYKWGTGVTIPTDVTLAGGARDIWIFQVGKNLDISSATKINLSGGAQADNVFWVVAGQTTIGTNAVFNGNILDKTAIVVKTGAELNGRALSQTAVTLDSNRVTMQTATFQAVISVTVITVTKEGTSSTPYINSITPSSGVFGTTVEILGSNLTGVEGDVYFYFERADGNKIRLSGIASGKIINTSSLQSMEVVVTEPCQFGQTVCVPVQLTTGTYKVYAEPRGVKSNVVDFTITPSKVVTKVAASTPVAACTRDAKKCPDGSFVGRTGPYCEFADCPELSSSPIPPVPNFGQQVKMIAVSLRQGHKNDNVTILQRFLIAQDKGPAAKALAKVGATSFFGPLTRAALAEFQKAAGIPALGNFGPITRAHLNENVE